MKRLFRKSQRPQALPNPSPADFPLPQAVANSALAVGLQPKYTVPPVPHPTPHYRLAVLATRAALLIRPVLPASPTHDAHLRIPWGSEIKVEEVDGNGDSSEDDWSSAAIVFGILGALKLNSGAYVLVITAKTDVGCFLDPRNEVYGLKSATSIPLQEAQARTIVNAIAIRYKQSANIPDSLSQPTEAQDMRQAPDNDEPEQGPRSQSTRVKFTDKEDVKLLTPRPDSEFRPASPSSMISSGASTPVSESDEVTPVAKALASRLSFWAKFSKRQSTQSVRPEEEETLRNTVQGKLENSDEEPSEVLQDILDATSSTPATVEERQNELDDKILNACIREFTKGGMYFAYNFDITTSLQHKQLEVSRMRRRTANQSRKVASTSSAYADDEPIDVLAEPNPTLPLWRRVSKQFWWNESMTQPFIDAGLHSYVLPVMQGFYQVTTFHVPRVPEESETGDSAVIDYIVISRRSRDRAGLRYQRRGIDDDANVANFVETEAVARVEREGTPNVFSYIQIRGSIPLFWTQSGYNLKPPPLLSSDRTHRQNLDALRRHFSKTIPRYGPHTLVNLAEQQGKEGAVTTAYREYANELGSKDVRYTEYDFHTETKGMKYENIAILIKKMEKTFDNQGYTWISGGNNMSEQKAVFRVNCIDCLDRTNVVQSAFARHILNKQLGAVALLNPTEAGRTETDVVFNDVWANNGDAISRAYAGTSALKSDYTRTGKRDLGGLLNDGMNSLARMYSSTFSDWFSQAVIDFILGYRTLSVFSEFLLKLQSTDPRERIRIYKIRAEAIATSVSRVLSEGERLLSGWTLLSPAELNARISDKFEEKVVLLSVHAVYIVSYDYTLEKVAKYTRVPLGQITGITKGTYILSPLEEGSRDPVQNHGFMVSYLTSGETTRVTSYSLRNSADADLASVSTSPSRPTAIRRGSSVLSRVLSNTAAERGDAISFVAFKALPIDPARARRTTGSFEETADDLSWAKTCKEAVEMIVNSIQQAVADAGGAHDAFVTEGEIVSLADAQRMTTVVAKMEYGLKRLLWLGS